MNRRGWIVTGMLVALAATATPAAAHERSRLAVDVALDAHPATAATDGDAATTWCPSGAPLTVALWRPARLTGLGATLATATTATLAWSRDGRHWASTRRALPAGAPAYVRLRGASRARFVRYSGDACIGELRAFAHDRATRRMQLGADLSFTQQEEAAGNTFTDNGRAAPVERIFRRHGANAVRLRLWIDPPAGYSDLASDLAMARRVKAAGMKLYLDIHYSDFWADPQHQDTPAIWQGQDLPTLTRSVHDYTRDVLAAFALQGTPVDLVSIGNEIRNGILWPTGQIEWGTNERWDALAALLKAGVAGAREGSPRHHRPQVMLHFDQGGDNAASRYFFDNLVARGVPFDVIGLSYYPFWHGTLSQLRTNLDDLATRYDKDVMIAEHQYAWTLGWGDSTNNFVWSQDQLTPGYPAAPAGQLSMANDILSMLARVPDRHGAGFFYWEPEWIPGVGWEPGAGTPNDNLTLFDFGGAALPSIGLFEDPVRATG
jgi:arabinogalactan endo-1,4-beta-galactosidase